MGWQTIGGSPTYVIQRGKISANKPLVLIIPGNPGVADFYLEFIECLAKESNELLPIACISHLGHVTVPSHISAAAKDHLKKWPMLTDQIQHKLAFINTAVPANTPLILVGHSIGCYMILEMLKSLDAKRVIKCFLLFPTIERMSQSPSGRYATPLLQYFRWMLPVFTYPICYLIPDIVKHFLIKLHFRHQSVAQCAVDGVMKLLSPLALGSSAHLANDELQVVTDADVELLSSNIDKLFFYYGANDHWCPVEFYKEMKERFPDADIQLCKRKFEHAFVLESSSEMASVLWAWIQQAASHVSPTT